MRLLALTLVRLIGPLHVPSLTTTPAQAPDAPTRLAGSTPESFCRHAHPRRDRARTKGAEVYKSACRPSISAGPQDRAALARRTAAADETRRPAAGVHRCLWILWIHARHAAHGDSHETLPVDPVPGPAADSARLSTPPLPHTSPYQDDPAHAGLGAAAWRPRQPLSPYSVPRHIPEGATRGRAGRPRRPGSAHTGGPGARWSHYRRR